MKILSITVFLVSLIGASDGYSQQLEYPKNIDWNKAGAVTEFPEISEADSVFHVPTPDSSSDQENIQAAIDAAGSSAGVNLVLLPEGTYNLNRPLVLNAGIHDNVYIKGAGANHLMNSGPATTLSFDFTNPDDFSIPVYGGKMNAGIAFKGGGEIYLGAISSYDPSTNRVTVTGSSQGISKGDIIRVRSNKPGISCKKHPCMGQINRVRNVLNVSPLVLELEHDFSLTWEQQEEYGGLNLDVHKINALQNVGISSLGIETVGYNPDPLPDYFACNDEPKAASSPHGYHILAFRVYNAHMKDLYSYRPVAHHIYMIESLNNTVVKSFFNDAIYRHGCNGGHGYGVNLFRKSTLNLVENNVFRYLRRSLMFNRGAHKNVIGYNYSREVASQTGSKIRGDLSSRNMSDSGNLAEGNILDRILNDTHHEKTYTSYKNVYFRNSTYYNYLENEGGIENYFIGNHGKFSGNHDPSSVETALYGFTDSEALTIDSNSSDYSNESILNRRSLYHSAAPAFIFQQDTWNPGYTWPPLGPRLNHQAPLPTQDIPARGRYCDAFNDYFDSAYHCSQ